jgi:hypothetical protein
LLLFTNKKAATGARAVDTAQRRLKVGKTGAKEKLILVKKFEILLQYIAILKKPSYLRYIKRPVQVEKLRSKIMTFKITATAPTSYQLQSLRTFGIGADKNGNGSFSGEKEFDTEEEAKDYLKGRASIYNESDPEGTEQRLAEMHDSIEKYGSLTLDAVTANIEGI